MPRLACTRVLVLLAATGLVFVSCIEWQNLANSPTAILTAVRIEEAFYGYTYDGSEFFKYDILADTWTSKPLRPSNAPGASCCAAVSNGRALYAGGVALTATEVYDPKTDSWASKMSIPNAGAWSTATNVDSNTVIVLRNGWLMQYSVLGDAWVYKANPPVPHNTASFEIVGPHIFACGHYSGAIPYDDMSRYTIATDAWTTLSPLPVALGVISNSGHEHCGVLYLFGGRAQSTSPSDTDVILAFTPEYTWTTVGYLPAVEVRLTVAGYGDRVFLASSTSTSVQYATLPTLSLCGDPVLKTVDGRSYKLALQPGSVYTLLSSPCLSVTAMVDTQPSLPAEDNVVVTHVGVWASLLGCHYQSSPRGGGGDGHRQRVFEEDGHRPRSQRACEEDGDRPRACEEDGDRPRTCEDGDRPRACEDDGDRPRSQRTCEEHGDRPRTCEDDGDRPRCEDDGERQSGGDAVWLVVTPSQLTVLPCSAAPDTEINGYQWTQGLSVTRSEEGSVLFQAHGFSFVVAPQMLSLLVSRSEQMQAHSPTAYLDFYTNGCPATLKGLICECCSTAPSLEQFRSEEGSLFGSALF